MAEKLGVDFLDLFAKGNRPLDESECPHCGRRLKDIADITGLTTEQIKDIERLMGI